MKKNRKNKTKSLLVCAVLAGVLGAGAVSPVCPVGAVAEAAEMPVFGLWNEGLKLSHVHWAFPQTVISPTQLAGGADLEFVCGILCFVG